jgi:hypothetical protein
MQTLLKDIIPMVELYNIDENNDWLEAEVGKENKTTVRLARTMYLLSKLAHNNAGKLCRVNCAYPKLWQRMEKEYKSAS